METCLLSALDRPAADLTVMDVYDIAVVLGQEFERTIDRYGCESLVGVVPKVVRVLELLEALVSRGAGGPETEELRRELERLRQERSDRYEQERKHQKVCELELVEDVWRGEVQDLLSQSTQLQAENKRLLVSLSLKESPVTEEDLQKQKGMSEKERQVMRKLEDLVDRQRDEIRAKNHELKLRNEDVEALQMQQHRLIRINQDLRHRQGLMEAQGRALIQQRAELEAAALAQQQEAGALQLEVTRLRKELRDWEVEREIAEKGESSLTRSGILSHASPQMKSSDAAPSNSIKPNSVWVECGGDPGFLAKCFERSKSPSLLPRSSNRENNAEEGDQDEDTTALLLAPTDTEQEEETDCLEQDSDKPRFTLQELRDVLQERNELKAQVFVLQEELAYYKSDETEDDVGSIICTSSPPPHSNCTDQPESGIRRLIFTAIMPMVAAGLIADDPTLLPVRRLVPFV
ncbi:RILP-like protein 1 isoform X2 [Xiphias gladius]|uniref:RILP-like protein 1 isoform X2 n=1 Tax=Xiphias gladius TaxID=8245 RepID=UPI001A994EA1|nr:RILP-like protein 1 isoform X2 [Xiphias gladius]